MIKQFTIFITFLLFLSTIYSNNRVIHGFELNQSVLPYTYDFQNKLPVLGIDGDITYNLSYLKNSILLGAMVQYRSFGTTNDNSFYGSFFRIHGSLSYKYKFSYLTINPGIYFLWNSSSFYEIGIGMNNQTGYGIAGKCSLDLSIPPHRNFNIINSIYVGISDITFANNSYFIKGDIAFNYNFTNYLSLFASGGIEYFYYKSENTSKNIYYPSYCMGIKINYIGDKKKRYRDFYYICNQQSDQPPPPKELKQSIKNEQVETTKEQKKVSELYTKIKNTQKNTPIKFYEMVFEGTSFDKKTIEIINNIADYMKENKTAVILITGYATNGTNDEKIIREATQRATAIRNYLIKNGVPDINIKRDPSAIIADSSKGIKPYIEIKFLEK